MDNITPYNEANSIKLASFAIEFSHEISIESINEFIDFRLKTVPFFTELPGVQEHQSVTYSANVSDQQVSSKLSGVTFFQLAPDGNQEWTLTLIGKNLIVRCGIYTRWTAIFDKVRTYFEHFLPILADYKTTRVMVEYVDEFKITSDDNLNHKLFSLESKYLPPNIFESTDFWHSHHGFFSESKNELLEKILNNVDVNYFKDDSQVKKIIAKITHNSMLKNHKKVSEIEISNIFKIFTENHNLNKNIVSDLLSTEMCNEIGLEKDNA